MLPPFSVNSAGDDQRAGLLVTPPALSMLTELLPWISPTSLTEPPSSANGRRGDAAGRQRAAGRNPHRDRRGDVAGVEVARGAPARPARCAPAAGSVPAVMPVAVSKRLVVAAELEVALRRAGDGRDIDAAAGLAHDAAGGPGRAGHQFQRADALDPAGAQLHVAGHR